MMHAVSTVGMGKEEWLEERRKSLGGSEIAAVLGMNPYTSAYAVWAEKTGRIPPREDNEAMRQGRDLEEYVAQRFAQLSGKRVRRKNAILRNDQFPGLHASIDREIVGEKSGVECKTASALSAEKFEGDFPDAYYCQCVCYLAVTGYQRWYLAVLILGKAFKVFQLTTCKEDACPVWCDGSTYVAPEEMQALTKEGMRFWRECVQADRPPQTDGSQATQKAIKEQFCGGEGCVALCGREALVRQYFQHKAEENDAHRQAEAIKQQLMVDMQNAQSAYGCGFSISWKNQVRKTLDIAKLKRDLPMLDWSSYYQCEEIRPFKIQWEGKR